MLKKSTLRTSADHHQRCGTVLLDVRLVRAPAGASDCHEGP